MSREESSVSFLLRPVMERLGMSQRKLSKLLDVSQTHIRRFHSGRYMPSWPSACKIAKTLGVSVGVFLEGDPAHTEFFGEKGGRR